MCHSIYYFMLLILILTLTDGVSDGSFTKLQGTEIQAIRQGFVEFKKEIGKDTACGNCTGKFGCVHCCPPMTFLVCFTRNRVKIVPADSRIPKLENVLSGTCLDELIMDFQVLKVTPPRPEMNSSTSPFIYTEPDGKGYDFILVSHGGRLGTSKTVHYRCILNENAVFSTGTTMPLTKQTLELLTYHMSYQYTTASKVSNTFF